MPLGRRVPVVMYMTGSVLNVYNLLDRPETQANWALARKYYLEGFVRKDAASTEDDTPDLASGKLFATWAVTHPGALGETQAAFGFPFYQVSFTPPVITNDETMGAMNFISITSRRVDQDRGRGPE